MPVTLRAATPEDAATCGSICYHAFRTIAERHGFPPDFPSPEVATGAAQMFLGRSDVFGVVAELDDRVVGSNFLWETASIAGVGPITVHPSAQDTGAGRLLMKAVLERAEQKGFPGVRLVQAAYHSRSLALYTRLGFEAREPLSVMQGPPVAVEIPGHQVRKATTEDLDACDRLCMAVHGHTRRREIQDAIEQGSALVVEHDARLTGYSTTIGFFGHAVSETNNDMKALIGGAPGFAGIGFHVPTRNGELLRWCLEHGLRIVQPMTLMSRGLYSPPGGAFLPSIIY